MAMITDVGQSLIAAAVGGGAMLQIDKFVFANVPGLDLDAPEPSDEVIPPAEQIVFERAPTKAGIIDDNRVTYSQMMLTDIGDFEFNWIGLVNDAADGEQLVMFAYVPLTQKVKTQGTTSGNALTRNMVIEHLGLANATPVIVSAESWMYDFGDELDELLQRIINVEEELPNYASAEHKHNASDITAGTLNKERLPAASTSEAGATQLSNSITSSSETLAATSYAVNLVAASVKEYTKTYTSNDATDIEVKADSSIKIHHVIIWGTAARKVTFSGGFEEINKIIISKVRSDCGLLTITGKGMFLPDGTSSSSHTFAGGGEAVFTLYSDQNLMLTSISGVK